jgi:GNAT superfamily N-acetyltransferase
MNEINYRWIHGPQASQEDWEKIELLLASRGWISLNRPTSSILIAEDDDGIAGFHIFQFLPYAGPLFVRPSARGKGVAEKLADDMLEALAQAQARGFIVIADSPHSAKLCRDRGMNELKSPVFVMGGEG